VLIETDLFQPAFHLFSIRGFCVERLKCQLINPAFGFEQLRIVRRREKVE
jgi:hypothetical protein